jgi:hypothetical protein
MSAWLGSGQADQHSKTPSVTLKELANRRSVRQQLLGAGVLVAPRTA